MRRFLRYHDISGKLVFLALEGTQTVRIGRDSRCQIHYNDPTLSSAHCRIVCDAAGCQIEDLESTNGTYVNERALRKGQKEPLKPDDTVRCGRLQLHYFVALQSDTPTQDGASKTGPAPEPKMPEPSAETEALLQLQAQRAALDTSLVEARKQIAVQQRAQSKTEEELSRTLRCAKLLQTERERLQHENETSMAALLAARAEIRELKLSLDSTRHESAQAHDRWQQIILAAQKAATTADTERKQVLSHSAQLSAEQEHLRRVNGTQKRDMQDLQVALTAEQQRVKDLMQILENTERQLFEQRRQNEEAMRKLTRRFEVAQSELQRLRQEKERVQSAEHESPIR